MTEVSLNAGEKSKSGSESEQSISENSKVLFKKSGCALNNRTSILLIDDEPAILESTTAILEAVGFHVIPASSVKVGINRLERVPSISIILCDLMMPRESGFVFLNYLKTNLRFKRIPIIILTSRTDNATVKKTLSYCINDYISKPFSGDKLVSKINEILDSVKYGLLIVTNRELVCKVILQANMHKGYKEIVVSDGHRAIDVLNSRKVDIIISDLELPDISGFNLMGLAKEINPDVIVLFIANRHLSESARKNIIAAGGHGVLRLPLNNYEVSNKIESLLHRR